MTLRTSRRKCWDPETPLLVLCCQKYIANTQTNKLGDPGVSRNLRKLKSLQTSSGYIEKQIVDSLGNIVRITFSKHFAVSGSFTSGSLDLLVYLWKPKKLFKSIKKDGRCGKFENYATYVSEKPLRMPLESKLRFDQWPLCIAKTFMNHLFFAWERLFRLHSQL